MAKKTETGRGGATVAIVERIVKPVAEAMELLIWDVVFEKEGADWVLRVMIDRREGIDLETCERFSRAIDPLIDEADPIEQSYCLEVSSPGLNRELTRPWHFERYLGEPVLVRTIRPIDGQRDFAGVLTAYEDHTLTLAPAEKEPLRLRISEIAYVKSDDFDRAEESF